VAGVLWAAGDVIGIFVPSGIANIAHLSGMLFGLIMGAMFRGKRRKKKSYVDEESVRKWEVSWHGRL